MGQAKGATVNAGPRMGSTRRGWNSHEGRGKAGWGEAPREEDVSALLDIALTCRKKVSTHLDARRVPEREREGGGRGGERERERKRREIEDKPWASDPNDWSNLSSA